MRSIKINVAILTQIFAFAVAIITPVLYVSDIKEDVAIHGIEISTIKEHISEIKENSEYVRRWVEMNNKREAANFQTQISTSTRQ